MGKVVAVANQKGGVGKTTTSVHLAIGAARMGYRVLAIDMDPQGNLTQCLGYKHPDEIEVTIASIIEGLVSHTRYEGIGEIITCSQGIDLIPANLDLSGADDYLSRARFRDTLLKRYIDVVRDRYDLIVMDCAPSLSIMVINALVCADSVIIPVKAEYLPKEGIRRLLEEIEDIRPANPDIRVEGMVITMHDVRTNNGKHYVDVINEEYGESMKIFKNVIPQTVKLAECSEKGTSIYEYAPGSKAAIAYEKMCQEVMSHE